LTSAANGSKEKRGTAQEWVKASALGNTDYWVTAPGAGEKELRRRRIKGQRPFSNFGREGEETSIFDKVRIRGWKKKKRGNDPVQQNWAMKDAGETLLFSSKGGTAGEKDSVMPRLVSIPCADYPTPPVGKKNGTGSRLSERKKTTISEFAHRNRRTGTTMRNPGKI